MHPARRRTPRDRRGTRPRRRARDRSRPAPPRRRAGSHGRRRAPRPARVGTVSSRGVRRRWPLALAVSLVAAEVAVLLLRPRGVLAPSAVDVKDFFTPEQIERAEAFRTPQLAIFGAQLATQAGVLVWLVARPPRALTRERRHPLLAGAVAGAGISLALAVGQLPLSAVSESRARHVGLSTQDWGGWTWDVVRGAGVGAALAAVGGLLAVAVLRRFPRRWWIPGTGIVVVLAVVFLWLAPVVLDPVFNRFTRVPDGPLRTEVLGLARKAGV